ncbi:MAG: hypothetical protein COA70_12700 [Planctomycetota bacterium]|nr:MAG: hypothetical protein COA70_12700 [Planctomycetota bacterium]
MPLDECKSLLEQVTKLELQLEHSRQENKSLRESEIQHRAWLEQSPVCTKILNLDFNLLYMSSAGVAALAIERIEDYYGKPYPPEFFSESFRVTMLEQLRNVRSNQVIAFQEASLKSHNGNILWFRSTLFPLFDDAGALESIMVVSVDISERVKAEEERVVLERQMLHAQKLESLGVLAGGIAHDFNNILMSILGNADLARHGLANGNAIHQNIAAIEVAAHRAAELSGQMLAYSGKGKFLIESIDIGQLLTETAHLLDVVLSKNTAIKLEVADSLPQFAGDPTQLRQVIMNLITNAAEAIGQGSGTVTLTAGWMECDEAYLKQGLEILSTSSDLPPGAYVYCEVTDTGCGMDADTLAKVFDPFFTTKFTGRGLGMAAVLGIVRGHKGTIKATSEVNKGTSFRVLFPVDFKIPETILATSTGASASEDWRGSGTVLIADDEELVRNVGKEMLSHLGFQPLEASDGERAIQVFREHADEITCVLLDLTMPNLDGEQTLSELRKIRPDVKVILTSGYSKDDLSQRFAGLGLTGFLQKPFSLEALSHALAPIVT